MPFETTSRRCFESTLKKMDFMPLVATKLPSGFYLHQLGIRFWPQVWTKIKNVLTGHVGTKLTKPFQKSFSPKHTGAIWTFGNIFCQKEWENIFWGSFAQQLLLLRSHRLSSLFLLLCGSETSERNSVGTLDTKTSSQVKSTPVFMPFTFFCRIHSLNFSFASFQTCSFTGFYSSSSSLLWSFLCNLTRKVYASLTANQQTLMDR